MLERVRVGAVALAAGLWAALVLDALPWGLDLDQGGLQGLVRAAAVLVTFGLLMHRHSVRPVDEVYQAGFAAGQRAARDKAGMDSHGSRSTAAWMSRVVSGAGR